MVKTALWVVLSVCLVSWSHPTIVQAEETHFEDPESGVRFVVPEGWAKTKPKADTLARFDRDTSVILVIVRPVTETTFNLLDYAKGYQATIAQFSGAKVVLAPQQVLVNGKDAVTSQSEGNTFGIPVSDVNYAFYDPAKQRLYQFALTCTSSRERCKADEPDFMRVLTSFTAQTLP